MKIAIDIDNTILDYDGLFAKAAIIENIDIANCQTKDDIKSYVTNHDEWLRLQGRVYGELIEEATIEEAFLLLVDSEIFEIELVSHRSKTSYCGRYDLHKALLSKLKSCKLNHLKINLFEESSEKIEYINRSGFNIVIDDLANILSHIDASIFKIHRTYRNKGFLNLFKWNDIFNLLGFIKKYSIGPHITPVGRNSFKFCSIEKQFFIKIINDIHRVERELGARNIGLLRHEVIISGECFFVENFIEHQEITRFDDWFCKAFKVFFNRMQRKEIHFYASHGIRNNQSYIDNIGDRLSKLNKVPNQYKEILEEIINKLEVTQMTRSICFPDFHRKNFSKIDDHLYVFDFESFGHDDLSRSFLNAIHHVGQDLDDKECISLIGLFSELATDKKEFWKQTLNYYDLIAFEWLLIMAKHDGDFERSNQYLKQMLANKEQGNRYWSWQQKVVSLIHERF